jgi:octaprenyl-diphosphate synthase
MGLKDLDAYGRMVTEMRPALDLVDRAIESNLSSEVGATGDIVRHLLGGGGKRLRPLLLIACSRLCGHRENDFAVLGAVIEYLHSATLLHDDVLDEALLRRGKPSANATWGNTRAILGGDFLFARAYHLLAGNYPKEIALLISRTAQELVEGEILELSHRNDPALTVAEYDRIILRKTASLIAASCEAGGLLAGAPADDVAALRLFGTNVGLAFQIIDDVLDYTGDQAAFGKVRGGDLREGTVTLPLIMLRENRPSDGRVALDALIAGGTAGDAEVAGIVDEMRRTGIDRRAIDRAAALIASAKGELERFADSPYRRMLRIAADHVLSRSA